MSTTATVISVAAVSGLNAQQSSPGPALWFFGILVVLAVWAVYMLGFDPPEWAANISLAAVIVIGIGLAIFIFQNV